MDEAKAGSQLTALSDESLADVAGSGDEAAFHELFERHRRRIARIAGRFFRQPARIEELVQEIFAKLYFALGSFSRARGQSFASWLASIAINACYDELRRLRRRPESTISEVTAQERAWLASRYHNQGAASAEDDLIARDLAGKLLARLNADDRLVLTLLDVEEMSVSEIAAVTGWSISKVKVRAHRARAALRQILKEYI